MHESQSHIAPSQTLPDIYVSRAHFPIGAALAGSYHQWEIYLTLRGSRSYATVSGEVRDEMGDLSIVKPKTWIDWRVSEPLSNAPGTANAVPPKMWDVVYALFHPRPHWSAWLDTIEYRSGVAMVHFSGEPLRKLTEAMLDLHRTYETRDPLRDDWSLLALEKVLMTVRAHVSRQRKSMDPRIHDIVELIHTGYANSITGPDLADAACLSVARMTSLFSAAMGTTPAEYVERIRLESAAEKLCRGALTVRAVARACGYPDANYFTRRFRRHYGQTPSEYRAASRGVGSELSG